MTNNRQNHCRLLNQDSWPILLSCRVFLEMRKCSTIWKRLERFFQRTVLSVCMCRERHHSGSLRSVGTRHTTTDNRPHNFRLQITSGMWRLRYGMANTLRKKQILTPRRNSALFWLAVVVNRVVNETRT